MKKLLFVISLVLALMLSAPVCSASSVSVNNDVVQAMLQSSLENGFSPRKDVQAMLDNALLNGYDYVNVTYNEKANAFFVRVAIDGMASALAFLDKEGSAESICIMMQAKDSLVSHCDSIIGLFDMIGRKDTRFVFELLDDVFLSETGFHQRLITIIHPDWCERSISGYYDVWDE